jgi:hypothetical protein
LLARYFAAAIFAAAIKEDAQGTIDHQGAAWHEVIQLARPGRYVEERIPGDEAIAASVAQIEGRGNAEAAALMPF